MNIVVRVIQIDNFEFEDVYVDGFQTSKSGYFEKDAAQQVIGMLSHILSQSKQLK